MQIVVFFVVKYVPDFTS